MILTALRAYKSKILIGLVIAAIAAGGYLVWQNRSLLDQRATLRVEKQQIMDANEANCDTIARLQAEIAKQQKTLRERAVEQDKIVSEYQRTVKDRDALIEQMRRDYEEIDDFLSIPVPDAFVDQWMRAKDRDADGDGVPEAPGGADGAE